MGVLIVALSLHSIDLGFNYKDSPGSDINGVGISQSPFDMYLRGFEGVLLGLALIIVGFVKSISLNTYDTNYNGGDIMRINHFPNIRINGPLEEIFGPVGKVTTTEYVKGFWKYAKDHALIEQLPKPVKVEESKPSETNEQPNPSTN